MQTEAELLVREEQRRQSRGVWLASINLRSASVFKVFTLKSRWIFSPARLWNALHSPPLTDSQHIIFYGDNISCSLMSLELLWLSCL